MTITMTTTTEELLKEAEDWADGFAETALVKRETYDRNMEIANLISLLALKVEKLTKENKALRSASESRIAQLKAAIAEGKIGSDTLNQNYIEGVDTTIEWVLSLIEADFEEDKSDYI